MQAHGEDYCDFPVPTLLQGIFGALKFVEMCSLRAFREWLVTIAPPEIQAGLEGHTCNLPLRSISA